MGDYQQKTTVYCGFLSHPNVQKNEEEGTGIRKKPVQAIRQSLVEFGHRRHSNPLKL